MHDEGDSARYAYSMLKESDGSNCRQLLQAKAEIQTVLLDGGKMQVQAQIQAGYTTLW